MSFQYISRFVYTRTVVDPNSQPKAIVLRSSSMPRLQLTFCMSPRIVILEAVVRLNFLFISIARFGLCMPKLRRTNPAPHHLLISQISTSPSEINTDIISCVLRGRWHFLFSLSLFLDKEMLHGLFCSWRIIKETGIEQELADVPMDSAGLIMCRPIFGTPL